MRRDLSTAAAIVMNTPEAASALLAAAPELARVPVRTIPTASTPTSSRLGRQAPSGGIASGSSTPATLTSRASNGTSACSAPP